MLAGPPWSVFVHLSKSRCLTSSGSFAFVLEWAPTQFPRRNPDGKTKNKERWKQERRRREKRRRELFEAGHPLFTLQCLGVIECCHLNWGQRSLNSAVCCEAREASACDRSSGLRLKSDRLVGLVVKASASRAEDPGFESRLCRDFFGVEAYQ